MIYVIPAMKGGNFSHSLLALAVNLSRVSQVLEIASGFAFAMTT